MSQCMDLKTPCGLGYSRMGSRLTGKTSSLQDANSRYSNHVKYKAGLYSTVVKPTDNIAKLKTITTFSSVVPSIDHQNPLPAQVNQSWPQKRTIAKRINGKVKSDVSKCTRKQLETSDAQSSSRTPTINELPSCLKDANSVALQKFPEDGTGTLEACSAILSKDTRKQIRQRPRGSFYAPTISSTLRLIASRDAKKCFKSCSQGAGAGVKKCNLMKNSSTISRAVPSASSHSIPIPTRRDTRATKMCLEGESTNSGPKSTSASSNRQLSSLNTRLSTVTTLKASSTTNRSKINDLLVVVKPLEHSKRGTTRGPTKFSSLGASRSSLRSLDNEFLSTYHNSPGRNNFSRSDVSSRSTSSPALGSMLTLCDPSADKDPHGCNNAGGIVEPPMIQESIEHNQGRTYERMLESESNLYLGRFNYHDQHREMRMDIDNMSYEELLELVEKIGSVSTGLTDEALTKCLRRSKFKRAYSPFDITGCVEDGNRCSICQEECADGEDIGALACEHWYHVVCIHQWLKQKNWCPICKSPACANR